MRFRLRTLLIVLGVAPPLIAGVWYLATELPLSLPGMACFAVFWVLCGVGWLAITRVADKVFGERRD
jgi:hypothetical protein